MITPVLRNTLKNTPKKSVEGLNVGDAVVLECDSRFGLKKGDTGVVSKNSDGYVSAKMDKDGSLIGFRVEENPFRKVVTEGGETGYETERLDAEYMEAVKNGDLGKCASMVEAAAKKNLRGTHVVDGNRNPLRVYHSSRNKNLKSFDLGFVPAGNVGFHFGPKEIADVIHRTKPGNHEPKAYYLDILNPMTFSEDCFGTSDCLFNELAVTGEILNHIRRGGQAYVELLKEFERMDAIVNDDYDSKYTDERYGYSDPKLHKLLLDTLYEAGYDGIVYANSCEGSGDICWIALDPHQVKSADPITYYGDGTVVPLSKRFDTYSEMVDESRAGDDVVARIMELVSKYDSGDLSANGVADGIAALSRETEVPEPVIRFTKAFATSVETLGSDSEGFDETIGSEYVDDIRDWCGNPVNEKTVCEEWRPTSHSISEAAKRAMPNTKAADSEGYPMMLYHGTSAYGFREFEGNSGFWASTAREYAEEYTESGGFGKPGVYRVFMNIENPLEVGRLDDDFDDDSVKTLAENMGVSFDELSDWMCDEGFDWREGSFPKWDVTTSVLFVEWLRELGFDGMHATEGTRDAETWCAFDSNQIKSAEDVTYSEDGVEIPVEDRFDMASNDINESQNTDDATYLAAAKTKNYKLCRKMVEEKAKVAFAGSRLVTKDGMPIKLYHGTAFNIHKFEGGLDTITWVTPDIGYADVYAEYDRHPDADNDGVIMSLYVYARNMVDIGDINEPFSEEGVRRIAKAIGCTYDELKSSIGKYSYDFLYEINEYVASIARKKGIDILVAKEGDLDHGVKRKVITIGVLDFNNIKSADPVTKYEDGTIVPLSRRFDFGTDDIREDDERGDLDVEYLDAVNSNDIAKASKMVRNVAKRSMPDTVVKDFNGNPIIVTHGTAFEFNVFKGDVFWFGTSKKILDMYSGEYDKRCFLNITNPFNLDKLGKNFNDLPIVWNNGTYFDSEHKQVKWFNGDGNEYRSHGDALISSPRLKTLSDSTGIPVGLLIEIKNEPMNDGARILDSQVYAIVNKRSFAIELEKLGYDGIIGTESGRRVFGALRPDQIKSAEPVTRDDDGNIIPLSKRFNLSSDDIREDMEEPVPPEPAAEIPPEEKKVELEKPCWKNPDDWKKDEFLVEFKNELGYRDEYFPTKSYSDCADSVAREYTLEMPTDTEAREIEGDAVMLLIKSGLKDSIKVAHELGEIVMGNRKGGPRHKKLLKAMQKAYHELVRCSARFDNDNVNESEESDSTFARWFRSSVVKDASGKPLVVYHGSSKSGITEFNEVRSGNGIFFTSSKEVANDYSVGKENQMYPCYLRIEHPFVIDAHGSKWSDMKFKEHRAVAKHAGYRWITPLEVIGYVTEVYRNEHPECDGIIIRNVVDTNASKVCADDYIVFNPKQIKSVDNGGTFSDNTSNIFESR